MRGLNEKLENNIWINSVYSTNLWVNLIDSLRNRNVNQVDVDIKSNIVSNLNNSLKGLEHGITYDGLKALIQKDNEESHDV